MYVYASRMATKTISIDLVAYERLMRAKRGARDSFSQVIRRARWEDDGKTCQSLLDVLSGLAAADDAVLERLEVAQREDSPPDHPWA